ncbi:MAG: hypothetical protein DCF30_14420 [Hyphomicrobiales bacterium]|nr:MAG: hypothetical protein DCF30_14420 [Hyphomicrobiales bacterium]
MDPTLTTHLNALRAALLTLKPTGQTGFEGLIALALHDILGVPFRLASSGTQRGIDGKTAGEGDVVAFEGKLYSDSVPRTEVLSKIADLGRNKDAPDLVWVLGATTLVSTQLADDLRADAAGKGMIVVILDWSETRLPELALALAMSGERVEQFLLAHIEDGAAGQAIAALGVIRDAADFALEAARLRASLDGPAMAARMAEKANAEWLMAVFSDRRRARLRLGQALSPLGDGVPKLLPRSGLVESLTPCLSQPADGKTTFVLGDEGCGKSWLVAQAWSGLASKPLFVVMTADAFTQSSAPFDAKPLLIVKLIEQTGDEADDRNKRRWARRLAGWPRHPVSDRPRLAVLIDGINQRPDVDWGRIIESMSLLLEEIGGSLLVSSRTPFFRDRVRGRLTIPTGTVQVPEWSATERDEILRDRTIEPTSLHPTVAGTLRNPRLLGIALQLLDKGAVSSLTEVSVSRLLFEHIRTSEQEALAPYSALDFARQLQLHARAILDRARALQVDDLYVFDADLSAVVDGRFFREVDGDPHKYELREHGLTLALGLSVVDRLRWARRNHRDLDETLAELLEPVAALDDTANVIFAALNAVSWLDDHYDAEVAASLVVGFANLQNPDQSRFPAFCSLAKERPPGFLLAARRLCLAGGHQPNFDWVQGALMDAAGSERAGVTVAAEAASWLSVHSVTPDVSMRAGAEQGPERAKKRTEIDRRIDELSEAERQILGRLIIVEDSVSALSKLAMFILAGRQLAPHAEAVLDWCFGQALNSDYGSPYKECIDLISLNLVDWSDARAALLSVAAPLRGPQVSRVGQWALVAALRSTGNPADAEEAHALVEALTKDRERFPGWRRIEDYCATDPCDPDSTEPDNIETTARNYGAIDVARLRLSMGLSSEDQFLNDARPGVARFHPATAAAKHVEMADHVLGRKGFPLRQGVLMLRDHAALLTRTQAEALIAKWRDARAAGDLEGLSKQDEWITTQYLLLLAFPSLTGAEQADILLEIGPDQEILLDNLQAMKVVDEDFLKRRLADARATGDVHRQYVLLEITKETDAPLSEDIRDYLISLVTSEVERLRTRAFGIIARGEDGRMLRAVADSGWNAADANSENGFEAWYGSLALIQAAKLGHADGLGIVERISPRLYGHAARILGGNVALAIAGRIDVSIQRAAGLDSELVAPDIELHAPIGDWTHPLRFSVSDRDPPGNDLSSSMRRFAETDAEFQERHRRNYDAFVDFRDSLTRAQARIVLDHLALDDFAAIVACAPEMADRWDDLLSSLPETRLSAVYNLVLLLAHALSGTRPDRTRALLAKIKPSRPIVRVAFGRAGVGLDAMAIWAAHDGMELDDIRSRRLDQARTDQDLATEVLAALLNGKQDTLRRYVERRVAGGEPAHVARGVMVAGFSDLDPFNSEILSRFEGSHGLIGDARRAASYAYDRNRWSRHWFAQIAASDEAEDFWRAKVLFGKIVDGRFGVWREQCARTGSAIGRLGETVGDGLKSRYGRWEKHRKKTLFGREAPSPFFLPSSIL